MYALLRVPGFHIHKNEKMDSIGLPYTNSSDKPACLVVSTGYTTIKVLLSSICNVANSLEFQPLLLFRLLLHLHRLLKQTREAVSYCLLPSTESHAGFASLGPLSEGFSPFPSPRDVSLGCHFKQTKHGARMVKHSTAIVDIPRWVLEFMQRMGNVMSHG